MLQYQTVSPDTINLAKQILSLPETKDFLLVGGTSLALQTGHRKSVDLDFFTDRTFDIESLKEALHKTISTLNIIRVSSTGFACIADNIKCDFYNWAVPFIEKPLSIDGLRLCSIKDIAAFKLDAITTRKEKKDFWDIDIMLNSFRLSELLQLHQQKFSYINIKVVLDAISAIDLADNSEEPITILPRKWEDIKTRIKETLQQYLKEKLERKELEKQERLRKAEELLKNKNKDS